MFGFLKSRKDRKAAEIAAIEATFAAATQPFIPSPAPTIRNSGKGMGIYEHCYTWDIACMQKAARDYSLSQYERSKFRTRTIIGHGNGD